MNNKFKIEIGGTEYTFTVTRRNNLLATELPIKKLYKLYDLGLTEQDVIKIVENPAKAEQICIDRNLELSTVYEVLNDDKPDNKLLEELFYQFIIIEHPDITREKAVELMDVADTEYGINELTGNLYLNDLLTSMSNEAFTMSENLKRKRVSWYEEKQTAIRQMTQTPASKPQVKKTQTNKKSQ